MSPRRLLVVLGLLVLAASIGCQAPAPAERVPNSATAERLARDFYLHAHEAGMTVTGLTVRQSNRISFDGRDAWQVEIRGTVSDAAGTTHVSAMILHVDAVTGEVTIYAQG